MKLSFIVLFACLSTLTFAQEKHILKVSNPQPRVGQSIDVFFDLSALNNSIDEQLKTSDLFEVGNSVFYSKDFKRTITFNEPGKHTIGPVKFSINNIEYNLDAIEIEVIEELTPQEGLWIRHVKTDTEQYLILEQMLPNESDLKSSENSFSYSVGGAQRDEADFAEIHTDYDGDFQTPSSQSSTRTVRD